MTLKLWAESVFYVLGLLLGFRGRPEKEEAEEERVAVSSQLAASKLA